MYKLAYVEDILDYAECLEKVAEDRNIQQDAFLENLAGGALTGASYLGTIGYSIPKAVSGGSKLPLALTGAGALAGLGLMAHAKYRSLGDTDHVRSII